MFIISNLREVPQFHSFVANRTWEAWWKSDGHSEDEIASGTSKIVASQGFLFILVAHHADGYYGHVLGIESDLESRPDLSPWVAALWVDSPHRKKGVATALLKSAEDRCYELNFSKIYLCATDEKNDFYIKRGWQIIAQDEADSSMGIFEKTKSPSVA